MPSQDSLPDFEFRARILQRLINGMSKKEKDTIGSNLLKTVESEELGAPQKISDLTKEMKETGNITEYPSIILSILIFDFLFFLVPDTAGNYIFSHWDDKFDLDINGRNFYEFILDSSGLSTFLENLCKLYVKDSKSKETIGSFRLILASRDYLYEFIKGLELEGKKHTWIYAALVEMMVPLDEFIKIYRTEILRMTGSDEG